MRLSEQGRAALTDPGLRYAVRARPRVHVTPEAAAQRGVPPVALVSVPLPTGYHALPPEERERTMRRALEDAAETACQQAREP